MGTRIECNNKDCKNCSKEGICQRDLIVVDENGMCEDQFEDEEEE